MGTNAGVFEVVTATVDITALTNANNEPWDPAANTDLDNPESVAVVGVENPGSYIYQWDHLEQAIYVESYGGTDPGAGTDVGEVVLRVEGRR